MKTSNEFLIGVYKEVGKNPDLLKVLNTKESLEKLVGGEIATFDYDNYVVIYRKDCKNLLPNVYADKFSKLGTTLRGTLFTVNKDNENKFKSITKEQAFKITEFFIRESFNYKNFEKKEDIFLVLKEIKKYLEIRIMRILNKIKLQYQNKKKKILLFFLI